MIVRPRRLPGALLAVSAVLFLNALAYHLYTAALPLYLTSLGFDQTLVGLVVAAGGLAQVASAVFVGPSIDRFGARALMATGVGCNFVASLIYPLSTAPLAFGGARMLQGFAVSAIFPSVFSLVPRLAAPRRQVLVFSSVGIAGNLAFATAPPLGLFLYDRFGPNALFLASGGAAVLCLLASRGAPAASPHRRPLKLAFDRRWSGLLLVALLSEVQFGVLLAFVPIEAAAAGANPGLLFTVTASVLLASRVPAGWLADRFGGTRASLGGLAATAASVAVLLLPLNDVILAVSGMLNGLGTAFLLPPTLTRLSSQTHEAMRGTAMSYWTLAIALGIALGSGAGGVFHPLLGFHGLLLVSTALCLIAAIPLFERAPVHR
jgi:MFS family permease